MDLNSVLLEDRSLTRPFKSVGVVASLPVGQVLAMSINHRQRLPDIDPEETDEWLEALRSVVDAHGVERARLLLHELMAESEDLDVEIAPISKTPYVCLLYTSPSPRDISGSRMPSSA